jgi:hypothetical protein
MLTLLASAARTESGTSVVNEALSRTLAEAARALFLLEVTAAATAAGDTLNVFIQSSIDGTVWDDFVHFTEVVGDAGAKKYTASWSALLTPTTAMGAPADGALAAGVKQGSVGTQFRVKWTVVDATTDDASFTFSLKAQTFR